jgi:hypothetical protein
MSALPESIASLTIEQVQAGLAGRMFRLGTLLKRLAVSPAQIENQEEKLLPFTVPPLPNAFDALEPYIDSRAWRFITTNTTALT